MDGLFRCIDYLGIQYVIEIVVIIIYNINLSQWNGNVNIFQ